MHIDIVSVGKTKNTSLSVLEEEYIKRSKHFFSISCNYYKTENKVVDHLQRKHLFAVLLTEYGKEYTSVTFSQKLQRWLAQQPEICFVVGDSAGVSTAVEQYCQENFALSQLTFPHEVARVLLLEQLYRAGTIWKNHPYHK